MLDDQQLAAIAANLANLGLNPVLHLRVIAALAPALLPKAVMDVRSTTHGGELIRRDPRQIAAPEFQVGGGATRPPIEATGNRSNDATDYAQNIPAAPKPNGAKRIPNAQLDKARSCLSANPDLPGNITRLAAAAGVSRPIPAKTILLGPANGPEHCPNSGNVPKPAPRPANGADSGLTTNGSKPPKPARGSDSGLGTTGAKRPLSAAAVDPARRFSSNRLANKLFEEEDSVSGKARSRRQSPPWRQPPHSVMSPPADSSHAGHERTPISTPPL